MTVLNFNIPSIVIVAALALLVVLFIAVFVWLLLLRKKIHHFFLGKNMSSLEGSFEELVRTLQLVCARQQKMEGAIAALEHGLEGAVQRVGIVRYNPYGDGGGDQSFSIALLDNRSCGIVISGLYSRDGVRVYAKPIQRGSSTYTLSEEENDAITKAAIVVPIEEKAV